MGQDFLDIQYSGHQQDTSAAEMMQVQKRISSIEILCATYWRWVLTQTSKA